MGVLSASGKRILKGDGLRYATCACCWPPSTGPCPVTQPPCYLPAGDPNLCGGCPWTPSRVRVTVTDVRLDCGGGLNAGGSSITNNNQSDRCRGGGIGCGYRIFGASWGGVFDLVPVGPCLYAVDIQHQDYVDVRYSCNKPDPASFVFDPDFMLRVRYVMNTTNGTVEFYLVYPCDVAAALASPGTVPSFKIHLQTFTVSLAQCSGTPSVNCAVVDPTYANNPTSVCSVDTPGSACCFNTGPGGYHQGKGGVMSAPQFCL